MSLVTFNPLVGLTAGGGVPANGAPPAGFSPRVGSSHFLLEPANPGAGFCTGGLRTNGPANRPSSISRTRSRGAAMRRRDSPPGLTRTERFAPPTWTTNRWPSSFKTTIFA